MRPLMLCGALALIPFATGAVVAAQEPVSAERYELEHVKPRYIDVNSLFNLLQQLHGRSVTTSDGQSKNLLLGPESVIVYDTQERLDQILKTVTRLDVRPEAKGGDLVVRSYRVRSRNAQRLMDALVDEFSNKGIVQVNMNGPLLQIQAPRGTMDRIMNRLEELDGQLPAVDDTLVSWHYRPRAIPINELQQVLTPFYRALNQGEVRGGFARTNNITVMMQQRMVLVRETKDQLEQIKAIVEAVDQPSPQVVVTAWVIIGENGKDGGDAPADLVGSLRELLPYDSYRVDAAGALRVGANTQHNFTLTLTGEKVTAALNRPASYQISARISAYDPVTPSLTFEQLTATRQGGSGMGQMFNTTTTVFGGEYAVLGVSGRSPRFVVLRIAPVEGAAAAPVKKGERPN